MLLATIQLLEMHSRFVLCLKCVIHFCRGYFGTTTPLYNRNVASEMVYSFHTSEVDPVHSFTQSFSRSPKLSNATFASLFYIFVVLIV